MGDRLRGRVGIVTGAGRGIGRAVAEELAAEGAAIVVADFGGNLDGSGRDSSPADETVTRIRDAGGRAMAHYGDVSKFADTQDLVAATVKEFGRLDILCHVAGILRDRMVFNMTEEEWDAVLAVHLKGAFNTARNALEPMLRQRYGRIVFFSSRGGLGATGQANYSAAKEGQVGLARALALELAPYGVTVNAVYPSANTRMMASVPETTAQLRAAAGIAHGSASQNGGAAPAGVGEGTPADPENNARPTAWLCSEAAAGVTGQVIGTSGWQTSRYSRREIVRAIEQRRQWTHDELTRAMPRLLTEIPNPAPRLAPKE